MKIQVLNINSQPILDGIDFPHIIYWKSPTSILGMSGFVI